MSRLFRSLEMKRNKIALGLLALLWLVPSVFGQTDSKGPEKPISFSRDIRPILSDRCFHCHGPDASNQESDFRLDSEENAKRDLGGYAGIVAGDLENSSVHERIWSEDDPMPPEDAVRQLSEDEKKLIDRWIASGGKYEKHWSFKPVPDQIQVPQDGDGWARNEIDRFVFSAATSRELTPQQEPRERSVWLRRVTFDLTGLPPTPEELAAFEKDQDGGAYERVVDRLLASNAYAERMAAEWLDVARYSDTYGYQRDDPRRVWPYRDWVLNAFRDGMGYDKFITRQLAGDLIPNATQDDILATAFNRLHSHKKEGGSEEEEFRMENVADRTHTLATAFLGLTMECARCHDHKYDPVTSKEYYQLSSFFSNIDENGLISFFTDAVPTPAIPILNESYKTQLAAAQKEIDEALLNLKKTIEESNAKFEAWDPSVPRPETAEKEGDFQFNEAAKKKLANWVEGRPAAQLTNNKLVEGRRGQGVQLTGDDKILFPGIGVFDRAQPFSFALWVKPAELSERAVIFCRSRAWDDAGSKGYELLALGGKLSAKIVHFWPGNALAVETDDVLQAGEWTHVAMTYDGSSRAAGLKIFVNGRQAKTHTVHDQLTREITNWGGGQNELAIGARFRDRGFKNGVVDEFQVYSRELSKLEIMTLVSPDNWAQGIQDLGMRRNYYLTAVSPDMKLARERLESARRKWNQTMDRIPAIMVMKESLKPRTNYLLNRGDYTARGEVVQAGTPQVLLPFGDRPRNRLGLAQWLTDPHHPLTARVTVNRYWQLFFGTGIVSTPEDFGLQGASPTHPELLDWLARDLIDHDWDIRRLFRKIVLSATYRQSSMVSSSDRNRDPQNQWLARFPRKRLSAEMIRDNALFVSGLLETKWGGPSVRTYDLQAAFKPSRPDKGTNLYRRSVYTFWQRTAPAPLLMTMNASKREVCRMKRDETNSPLQALLLLNGTQFVESARVCAEKLLESQADRNEMVAVAFQKLVARKPSERELKVLVTLLDEQEAIFQSHPEKAKQLLGVGDKPVNSQQDSSEIAALTVVVNAIMSLDEALRVR